MIEYFQSSDFKEVIIWDVLVNKPPLTELMKIGSQLYMDLRLFSYDHRTQNQRLYWTDDDQEELEVRLRNMDGRFEDLCGQFEELNNPEHDMYKKDWSPRVLGMKIAERHWYTRG